MARWANRLALRAARAVLAISDATRRDYIHHLGVRPDKIVTIPLAAEVGGQGAGDRGQGSGVRGQEAGVRGQGSGVSRNAPHALRTTHYALRNTHYVLYLGSNKPHKNLVRLIEAWRIVASSFQLPASGLDLNLNLSLVIAGSWDARYPEARHRVAELGLADRVVFLGPVAEAELPALYTGAELFVFPSLYEGFGLPVLEAMACGTPVVCSNVSSLPEVAGDAACQVNPLAVDELAAAIGRVLGDAALRQQMRERGLAQAARFSWPRTAQETLAVYRQITAGR
jgi:alpha-1,3-rhamnosyl/mannosyltransferase